MSTDELIAKLQVGRGHLQRKAIEAAFEAFASAHERQEAVCAELAEALTETWRVIDAAGLHNLARGSASWFVKASDARALSIAAIAKATGQ